MRVIHIQLQGKTRQILCGACGLLGCIWLLNAKAELCYDGQRAGAEESAKEAAYEDRLQVLCGRGCDGEEGEAKHGDDDGQATALELGQGGPERGTM